MLLAHPVTVALDFPRKSPAELVDWAAWRAVALGAGKGGPLLPRPPGLIVCNRPALRYNFAYTGSACLIRLLEWEPQHSRHTPARPGLSHQEAGHIMRDRLKEYYPLSQADFEAFWDTCLFVPDANALLNLYRYSDDTREQLLDLFKQVEDRLWIPHQVGKEFHENRFAVISGQVRKLQDGGVESQLGGILQQLEQDTGHPYISDELRMQLEENRKRLSEEIGKSHEQLDSLRDDDHIRDKITALFNGKVGEPFTEQEFLKVPSEGEERLKAGRPPICSRKDQEKTGFARFGDLIIWKQLLKHAQAEDCPVCFITDDQKEDWWWRHKDDTLGPHPELRKEFHDTVGKEFYIYRVAKFMAYAKEHLGAPVTSAAVEEVERTRRRRRVGELRPEVHNVASIILTHMAKSGKGPIAAIGEVSSGRAGDWAARLLRAAHPSVRRTGYNFVSYLLKLAEKTCLVEFPELRSSTRKSRSMKIARLALTMLFDEEIFEEFRRAPSIFASLPQRGQDIDAEPNVP